MKVSESPTETKWVVFVVVLKVTDSVVGNHCLAKEGADGRKEL